MSKFNPDFWEVPVPPEYFEQLTTEDALGIGPRLTSIRPRVVSNGSEC